jgi:predicted DNA-binding transcriptional regulator AlpA
VTRQTALATLAPRLICREAAAAYASVSPNIFDQMVEDGRMPKPRRLTIRRIAWDVRELDTAIDRLPIDGDDGAPDDGWGDDNAT